MALLSDYTAGTVTVAGTTVTGTGTGWSAASFQEGDIFIAAGFWAIVASVDSNTSLTLVNWAGPALSDAPYRLRYMSDGSRASAQARQLIDMLGGSGNLEAFSGLEGLPNQVAVFTGPGTMELRSYAAGLVPRGEWDVAETYNSGDLVIHDGNVFASLTDENLANEPPSTQTTDANWMYVPVAPGPEGPPGPSAPLGIGTVQQGTTAAASITGTVPNQQLNLTLPRGQQGDPGLQGDPGPPGNPGPANSLSIGTVSQGSTAGATITGTAPTQTLNLTLPRGATGDAGSAGWTPVFGITLDGARAVQEVIDWVGGTGDKPDVGVYVGETGFVIDIADAVNIRGASGSGTGDMQATTYDPQNIAGDAFLRSNMTGTQAISTVTGLQGALDGKVDQTYLDERLFDIPDVIPAPTSGDRYVYLLAESGGNWVPAAYQATIGQASGSIGVSANQFVERGTAGRVRTPAPADDNDATNKLYVDTGLAGKAGTSVATTSADGLMASTDKTKLNGIATGATANQTDAFLLARANHTGTQLAATISDFSTASDARISAAIGTTVQAYSAQLGALAGLSTSGIIARTGTNTVAARTVTGTTGRIVVTNGNGVSGNPTLDIGASVATLDVENQQLTGGAAVTSKSLGTISSGTTTLDMGDRPLQNYTNNGGHTLSPGSVSGSCLVDIVNGASAGAIATTGWTMVAGDSFTTVSGDAFRCHCSVGPAGSLLIVQALQ